MSRRPSPDAARSREARRSSSRAGVTVDTYRDDPLHPRVVRAVERLLAEGSIVAPVDVAVRMGLVNEREVGDWRRGRIPYLERVVRGSLTRLSRLLRILRFAAHDMKLVPVRCPYVREDPQGRGRPLRFTKTGDPRVEAAWATHLVRPGKRPFHAARTRRESD